MDLTRASLSAHGAADEEQSIRSFLERKLSVIVVDRIIAELRASKGLSLTDYSDDEIDAIAARASNGILRIRLDICRGLLCLHDRRGAWSSTVSNYALDPIQNDCNLSRRSDPFTCEGGEDEEMKQRVRVGNTFANVLTHFDGRISSSDRERAGWHKAEPLNMGCVTPIACDDVRNRVDSFAAKFGFERRTDSLCIWLEYLLGCSTLDDHDAMFSWNPGMFLESARHSKDLLYLSEYAFNHNSRVMYVVDLNLQLAQLLKKTGRGTPIKPGAVWYVDVYPSLLQDDLEDDTCLDIPFWRRVLVDKTLADEIAYPFTWVASSLDGFFETWSRRGHAPHPLRRLAASGQYYLGFGAKDESLPDLCDSSSDDEVLMERGYIGPFGRLW